MSGPVKRRKIDKIQSEKLPTPINPKRFAIWLTGYDQLEVEFNVSGFTVGFRIGVNDLEEEKRCRNQSSAENNPAAVIKYIITELAARTMAGPFKLPPFLYFICSPFGLREKSKPGDFRAIQNLSFPYGDSVNSHIPRENKVVRYPCIQDAISFVVSEGPGCYMAKTDIKKAFRLAPVHPDDYKFLGFCWNGEYYYDRVLPMGMASSSQIFQRIANALVWIAQNKLMIQKIFQYTDDAFLVQKHKDICTRHVKNFMDMCRHIGFVIAEDKIVYPTTKLTILGIELDSIAMCARLPMNKLEKCRNLVEELASKKSTTLNQLQSVIGTLNFACSVITPGRAFLRRLINLTIGKSAPNCWISLNIEAREDLRMWETFLRHYNGVSLFRNKDFVDNKNLNFFSDASSTIGYGALFGQQWVIGVWPPAIMETRKIAWMELYPITLGIVIWGHEFQNRSILFHSDNETVVSIINKQSTREPYMMDLIRLLVLASMKYNIQFKAVHISGRSNIMCDYLSRQQVALCRKRANEIGWELRPEPMEIPDCLNPSNICYKSGTEFWATH